MKKIWSLSVFSVLILLVSLIFRINSQTYPYTVWSKVYNAPSNLQDSSVAICVNQLGMVFVGGWSLGNSTAADIAAIRYNPVTGDTIWAKRFIGNAEDKISAMACDNNAVYVTGWTFSSGPSRDIITIKFNAVTGDTMWVKKYNGPRGGGDYGWAITRDAGFVYVTGRLSDTGAVEYQRFFVLKYDINTGANAPGFPYIYRGSTTNNEAHSIIVDNSGNIYITGRSNFNPGPGDVLTLKISSSGSLLWSKLHNASGNGADDGILLAFDNSQANLFVGGWGQKASFSDFIVIKYNASTGDSVAYASYNGIQGTDYIKDMVLDASDNVYITGWSLNGLANRYEIATLKYNSNLSQQWAARSSNADGWDISNSISLGPNNSVYVTGSRVKAGQGYNILTIRYNAATGDTIWTKTENGTANNNDFGSGVVVSDSQRIFITGSIINSPSSTASMFTARYSNELVGIKQVSSEIPNAFNLQQNYPNPFNPYTTIGFDIPKPANVQLVIYDVSGKAADIIAGNEKLQAGKYEYNWNASKYASGIYYCKLVAGSYSETIKMILVK